MGYTEGCQTATVLGCKTGQDREQSPLLGPEQVTEYRAAAARCNFLAIDRPDIQYSAKEASKYMSAPRMCDWEMIYKISKYLRRFPRLQHVFLSIMICVMLTYMLIVIGPVIAGPANRPPAW